MKKIINSVLFKLCCLLGGVTVARRFQSREELFLWVHGKKHVARMKKKWPPTEYACDMNITRKCVIVYKLQCGSLQLFFRNLALHRGYIFRSFLRNVDSEATRAE